VNTREIAAVFDGIAGILRLKKESIFKIRAYQKAARSIEGLAVEVAQLVAEDRLREVPGVGEAISRKITELVTTGKLGYYERLKAEFPEPAHSARDQVPDDDGE
jgi:DNA polymerase (family 10)